MKIVLSFKSIDKKVIARHLSVAEHDSKKQIKEFEQENPELRPIFDALKKVAR